MVTKKSAKKKKAEPQVKNHSNLQTLAKNRNKSQRLAENCYQEKSILPPYSFGLLIIACLFVTAFCGLADIYSMGNNVVFAIFFILCLSGMVLWTAVVFFKNGLLSKQIIITASIGIVATGILLGTCLNNDASGMIVAIAGVILTAAIALYMGITKSLTASRIVFLLIIAGFFIRLAYILCTDVGVAEMSIQERQHDVFYFNDSRENYRHSSYIEWFYNNFSLPKVKPEGLRQFYHPPLHHFVSAMWMRILTTLGMSYNGAVESIQILTLFYSSACMIIVVKILEFLKFKGMAIILPTALICFHPTLIILSGSVNNDMLSVVLAFGAVYAAMLWYKTPNIKNILITALLIGGSMTSKLSGGLIAPGVAFIFVVVLYKQIKKKGIKKGFFGMLPQFALFGLVCVPLGLWWQIRTSALFHVPLTYVPSLSESSDQFLGGYSGLERLLTFPVESIKNVFVVWSSNGFDYNEYNSILGLFKTAVFGEFELFDLNVTPKLLLEYLGGLFSKILFWSSIAVTLLATVGAVCSVVKRKYTKDFSLIIMFFIIGAVVLGNYINFCFRYPFTCTQNFRYCVPLLIVGAVFLGILCQNVEKYKSKFYKTMKWIIPGVVAVFSASSLMVYTLLGGK